MTSFCSACKLKQNQFVTETYINNNSANTIWFLFDYPYNFHSFLKHYTAQLKNFNILVSYGINCEGDVKNAKLTEIKTCSKYTLQYLMNYKPKTVIALGRFAIQSLNYALKLDIPTHIEQLESDYFTYTSRDLKLTIYPTYSPVIYFATKNNDILQHIHQTIEKAAETPLEIYSYVNRNKLNQILQKMQTAVLEKLTCEIDLNNYDIVLHHADFDKVIFTLYKPNAERKYLIFPKTVITTQFLFDGNIKRNNFVNFVKQDLRVTQDVEYKDLNSLTEMLGNPINFYAYPETVCTYYAILANQKNRQFYEPPYVVIDIEVLMQDNNDFPDPNSAQNPIICLTIIDPVRNKTYMLYQYETDLKIPDAIHFKTEKDLLYYTWQLLKDYILILGWNVYFDVIYLYKRAQLLQINIEKDIYKFTVPYNGKFVYSSDFVKPHKLQTPLFDAYDLMDIYKTYFSSKEKSYALYAIALKELGTTKEKLDAPISELWKTNPEIIIQYNKTDTELVVELNNRLGVLPFLLEIRNTVNMTLNYSNFKPTQIALFLYLNSLFKESIIPNYVATALQNISIPYTGAYVATPKPFVLKAKKR